MLYGTTAITKPWLTMAEIGLPYLGRLGNQLFQCASLMGLAKRYEMQVCLPPNQARVTKVFNINLPNIPAVNFGYMQYFGSYYLDDLLDGNNEPKFNINIRGNFQSEKYFHNVKDEIQDMFQFRDQSIDVKALEIIQSIKLAKNKPIAAIGVRRGDYLRTAHMMVLVEYYNRALETFHNLCGNCSFIVISDDKEWCREHFNERFRKYGEFYYVNGDDLLDFALMKHSDHVILANSTFHWWAAWLNPNDQKRIIAPKLWFKPNPNEELLSSHDLYCDDWVII